MQMFQHRVGLSLQDCQEVFQSHFRPTLGVQSLLGHDLSRLRGYIGFKTSQHSQSSAFTLPTQIMSAKAPHSQPEPGAILEHFLANLPLEGTPVLKDLQPPNSDSLSHHQPKITCTSTSHCISVSKVNDAGPPRQRWQLLSRSWQVVNFLVFLVLSAQQGFHFEL